MNIKQKMSNRPLGDNEMLQERPNIHPHQQPVYVVPQVLTYTNEEILEEMGPAQAGSGESPFGT